MRDTLLHKERTTAQTKGGFALLISVLIASVVLAVGLSISNVTLKQYIFSNIGRESEIAFYAADAGMECALYWDTSDRAETIKSGKHPFDIGNSTDNDLKITCMNQIDLVPTILGSQIDSGDPVTFKLDISSTNKTVCTQVTVTKYQSDSGAVPMPDGKSCPQGATCTQIESRGYNRPCTNLDDPRTVERALRANY